MWAGIANIGKQFISKGLDKAKQFIQKHQKSKSTQAKQEQHKPKAEKSAQDAKAQKQNEAAAAKEQAQKQAEAATEKIKEKGLVQDAQEVKGHDGGLVNTPATGNDNGGGAYTPHREPALPGKSQDKGLEL